MRFDIHDDGGACRERSGPDEAKLAPVIDQLIRVRGQIKPNSEWKKPGREQSPRDVTPRDFDRWYDWDLAEEAIDRLEELLTSKNEVTFALAVRTPFRHVNLSPSYPEVMALVFDAFSPDFENDPVHLELADSGYFHTHPITAAIWEAMQELHGRDDFYFCLAWRVDGEDVARFSYSDNFSDDRAKRELVNFLKEALDEELFAEQY